MSKSTTVKLPIHRKKQKGPHAEKAWEHVQEHRVTTLEQHSKSRQSKHFPSRCWSVKLEKNKGPKI